MKRDGLKFLIIFLGFILFLPFVLSAPEGFSDPLQLFNAGADGLISANDSIVYRYGHYSINGANWTRYDLFGSVYSGDWLKNSVAASINLPAGTHYVLVYSCSLVNNQWNCHGDQWQIRTVTVNSTSTYNLIFEETVEGPTPFSTAHNIEIGDWDYALQYVTSPPAHKGNKSARFEIREDQPLVKDGKRAEVTIVKGSEGHITKEAWYSFAVYFPTEGYEYDHEREAINQWYQSGSPSTSIRTDDGRILFEVGNHPDFRERIDLAEIEKDVWYTVVMHFIHSYEGDGFVELWYDGQKLITRNGGNMYDNVLPKWKIGVYKAAFKYNTSYVDKRIIYFDTIRVGNENATYEDMDPNQ